MAVPATGETVRIWRVPDEPRVLHRHFQRRLGITPLTYQRRSVS